MPNNIAPLSPDELDALNASLRSCQWEYRADILAAANRLEIARAVRKARRVLDAAKAMLAANRRALRALEAA